MAYIRHVGLIARGGFGEVHKVWSPIIDVNLQMRDENTKEVFRLR